jgi:5-dehydro-2-deoxygluconokinase
MEDRMKKTLDLITIGRSSVDLYGAQIGGRLEDMGSFRKYIGGSPTNIACGTARLGLKSAVITGVGDEHMGRFIREQLVREGVDIRGVKTDPERLTALVLLGIRDEEQFPLADLIARIIRLPELHLGGNIGVNKPDTDGDKPYFM